MTLCLIDSGSAIRRDAAVVTRTVNVGEVVLSNLAWATALLPKEKRVRCDHCHRVGKTGSPLMKCSRCAAYWYCSAACQKAQWDAHHRRVCKSYHVYTTSPEFQTMDEYRRTDALLLLHITSSLPSSPLLEDSPSEPSGELGARDVELYSRLDPAITFMSLMPSASGQKGGSTEGRIHGEAISKALYARFKNNNFILHSHLNPGYAHGAFPLASRFLNHSCVPNAAPRFVLAPGRPPRMEIVALATIAEGEEVAISYMDPATPFSSRVEALAATYDFTCTCELCSWIQDRGWKEDTTIPGPPDHPTALQDFGRALQAFVFTSTNAATTQLRTDPALFRELPDGMLAALHPSYLPALAAAFSKTSHDGPFQDALEVGRTLLAVYRVMYPPMFPMIGLHALELAKVAWNSLCTGVDGDGQTKAEYERDMAALATSYARIAREVLDAFGEEGDEGGPVNELHTIEQLLSQ